MGPLFQIGFVVLLLVLGFVAGRIAESNHYKSIRTREEKFRGVPTVSWRTLDGSKTVNYSELAHGSVVISVDHYKRFLMSFRKIFGGEIRSYASLLDRGRREALLRMKEYCPSADIYLNCRIETSTISNGQGKSAGTVEVLAYGTAVKYID
jgi:uncharacterized protein YbjQ (UPF0145 family)